MNENIKLGKFTKRENCRFCDSTNLVKILDFGLVPLAGAFIKEEDFQNECFYPLDLSFCSDCGLVQVSNVVPGEVLFKDHYFYFSSSIKTLIDHCTDFAKETYERFLKEKQNPASFEIGCNDGVMLRPMAELGVKTVGIDPATNVVNSVDTNSKFTIINDFFGEAIAQKIKSEHGTFDSILSSYSFAHIDDMHNIMKGVKTILKHDGVFIFEVYYLGTMIDEMQYDMIYHEHMSYYSLRALTKFLAQYGMEVFETKYTPGVRSGAVRFYARNINPNNPPVHQSVIDMQNYEAKQGFDKAETFFEYADKVNKTRKDLIELMNKIKSEGKTIIGYGASGRGTTIMNYCGIDGKYLDYVVDDAPAKHGYNTPGTHVPIKPWNYTNTVKMPDYALLFAWSFIDEVKKRRQDYLENGGKFIVPLPNVFISEQ